MTPVTMGRDYVKVSVLPHWLRSLSVLTGSSQNGIETLEESLSITLPGIDSVPVIRVCTIPIIESQVASPTQDSVRFAYKNALSGLTADQPSRIQQSKHGEVRLVELTRPSFNEGFLVSIEDSANCLVGKRTGIACCL